MSLAAEADRAAGRRRCSRTSARISVVLPQPDSPTIPSVSPSLQRRARRRRRRGRGRPCASNSTPDAHREVHLRGARPRAAASPLRVAHAVTVVAQRRRARSAPSTWRARALLLERRASSGPGGRRRATRASSGGTSRALRRTRAGSAAGSGSPAAGAAATAAGPGSPAAAPGASRSTRGDRAEQTPRVRVLRVVEQLVERALLDDAPGVHDEHAVGDVGDDAEVVGDEDDRRRRSRRAASLELVEDLRLDRHVERGRRLVGDQQLGRARQRHRDHHALAHAAGELVRVRARRARAARGIPTRSSSSTARSMRRGLGRCPVVRADLLDDLVADPVDRVERRHRVLEDHRDLGAADAPQLARRSPSSRSCAAEASPALEARVGRAREPHQRHRGHRLAASPTRRRSRRTSPRLDVERDAVDGLHEAVLGARSETRRSSTSSSGVGALMPTAGSAGRAARRRCRRSR